MKIGSKSTALWIAGILIAAPTAPAYAYLDAGTGSMILQLILGGVGGALIVGKLYWHKFKSIFVREKAEAIEGEEAESPRSE